MRSYLVHLSNLTFVLLIAACVDASGGDAPNVFPVDATELRSREIGHGDAGAQPDESDGPDASPYYWPDSGWIEPVSAEEPVREEPTEAANAAASAQAASADAVTTYCDCYQNEAPYNGDRAACVSELNGVAVRITPCDEELMRQYPASAAQYYECRRNAALDMDACFAGCSGRIGAITGCVVNAAMVAVGCGSGLDPGFVSGYEACHP